MNTPKRAEECRNNIAPIYWVAFAISMIPVLIFGFADANEFLFGGKGKAIVMILNGVGIFTFIVYLGSPKK